jgi:hypothetical protein
MIFPMKDGYVRIQGKSGRDHRRFEERISFMMGIEHWHCTGCWCFNILF